MSPRRALLAVYKRAVAGPGCVTEHAGRRRRPSRTSPRVRGLVGTAGQGRAAEACDGPAGLNPSRAPLDGEYPSTSSTEKPSASWNAREPAFSGAVIAFR